MPRRFWGERLKRTATEKVIPNVAKKPKFIEIQNRPLAKKNKKAKLKIKGPLVTQTIEVMKQTEMLQSLIDTYSNKSGSSNYLLNPSQMIPEVDFPPENAADFIKQDKFVKPIWFIPPKKKDGGAVLPKHFPRISAKVLQTSLRKAICGLLRVAGFTDIEESALILFADAIAEFQRSFVQEMRHLHVTDGREIDCKIEVATVEKAHYSMRNISLTDMHNYFKHNIITRNRTEIAEFNGVLQEYGKLMKESMQSMQKTDFPESDFINILEMPSSSEGQGGTTVINLVEDQPTTSA